MEELTLEALASMMGGTLPGAAMCFAATLSGAVGFILRGIGSRVGLGTGTVIGIGAIGVGAMAYVYDALAAVSTAP